MDLGGTKPCVHQGPSFFQVPRSEARLRRLPGLQLGIILGGLFAAGWSLSCLRRYDSGTTTPIGPGIEKTARHKQRRHRNYLRERLPLSPFRPPPPPLVHQQARLAVVEFDVMGVAAGILRRERWRDFHPCRPSLALDPILGQPKRTSRAQATQQDQQAKQLEQGTGPARSGRGEQLEIHRQRISQG